MNLSARALDAYHKHLDVVTLADQKALERRLEWARVALAGVVKSPHSANLKSTSNAPSDDGKWTIYRFEVEGLEFDVKIFNEAPNYDPPAWAVYWIERPETSITCLEELGALLNELPDDGPHGAWDEVEAAR